MAAISIAGLTKRFDDVVAVDDLSLSVAEGELFGLLGPNGAGKTTLVNVCCTLLAPTTGSASVADFDVVRDAAAVRERIGVVFQEPALDEELTGAENLHFHARLYGLSRAERRERVAEVLSLVDLADDADRRVGTYSGGMKRRLEIARGLVHQPEVLFLDEPTLGLDAATRRATWAYIRRLNAEAGVTVVLTTHYMEEADQLCDRVAVVDHGRIVALDSPAALKAGLGGDRIVLDLDGDVAPLLARLDAEPWVREADAGGGQVTVVVEHGERRIPALVTLASEVGCAVTSVDLRKPSLEEVFLSLTGHTLEGAASESSDADARPADGRAAALSDDGGGA